MSTSERDMFPGNQVPLPPVALHGHPESIAMHRLRRDIRRSRRDDDRRKTEESPNPEGWQVRPPER